MSEGLIGRDCPHCLSLSLLGVSSSIAQRLVTRLEEEGFVKAPRGG